MDIFIDNHIISLWRLYLVALTSIRIAAKIEETDFTLQSVEALNRCECFLFLSSSFYVLSNVDSIECTDLRKKNQIF